MFSRIFALSWRWKRRNQLGLQRSQPGIERFPSWRNPRPFRSFLPKFWQIRQTFHISGSIASEAMELELRRIHFKGTPLQAAETTCPRSRLVGQMTWRALLPSHRPSGSYPKTGVMSGLATIWAQPHSRTLRPLCYQCAPADPCNGARHSTAFSTSVSFPLAS
jgi:hypothetical protein